MFVSRLVEEVKEKTGVVLETDDVYMSTQFGDFVRTLVIQSRGGNVVELEYDAVSAHDGNWPWEKARMGKE